MFRRQFRDAPGRHPFVGEVAAHGGIAASPMSSAGGVQCPPAVTPPAPSAPSILHGAANTVLVERNAGDGLPHVLSPASFSPEALAFLAPTHRSALIADVVAQLDAIRHIGYQRPPHPDDEPLTGTRRPRVVAS